MTPAVAEAAYRLQKNKDFRLVLDAKLIEINELLLSLNPITDSDAVRATLLQYHAIRELGEYVAQRADERVDG